MAPAGPMGAVTGSKAAHFWPVRSRANLRWANVQQVAAASFRLNLCAQRCDRKPPFPSALAKGRCGEVGSYVILYEANLMSVVDISPDKDRPTYIEKIPIFLYDDPMLKSTALAPTTPKNQTNPRAAEWLGFSHVAPSRKEKTPPAREKKKAPEPSSDAPKVKAAGPAYFLVTVQITPDFGTV